MSRNRPVDVEMDLYYRTCTVDVLLNLKAEIGFQIILIGYLKAGFFIMPKRKKIHFRHLFKPLRHVYLKLFDNIQVGPKPDLCKVDLNGEYCS